jgi:hypothetical protein
MFSQSFASASHSNASETAGTFFQIMSNLEMKRKLVLIVEKLGT